MLFDHPGESLCFRNLTRSGAVVVSAMRTAPAGAAATMSCFVNAFGEERGRPCYVVFLQIVHTLALYGRRRMRVGAANWPTLTHDELAFARCVDSCSEGDGAATEAHVAWLVRPPGACAFTEYAGTLATVIDGPMLRETEGGGALARCAPRPSMPRATVRRAMPVAISVEPTGR